MQTHDYVFPALAAVKDGRLDSVKKGSSGKARAAAATRRFLGNQRENAKLPIAAERY
jgi:hypothetical protein